MFHDQVHVGTRAPRRLAERFAVAAERDGYRSVSQALRAVMGIYVETKILTPESDGAPVEGARVESPAAGERSRGGV